MPSLEQLIYDNPFSLFKGEPGLRKSGCALSYPRSQYWFSWDRKMDALLLPMQKWGIKASEIEYDDYTDWDKPRIKMEQLVNNCKYKTVIVDSITSGADAINRQTLKVKSGSGKSIAGIPVNSIEDFNAEDSALKEMISLLKTISHNHNVHVVIIAHVIQKEMKSADGKTHFARQIVTAGKGIAQKIPAYCSEVYHFNIKQGMVAGGGGQYSLLTTHTGDDFARTSLPLPAEIVFGDEPLYDKWIAPGIKELNNRLKPTTT